MFKRISIAKDTYITNKSIRGTQQTGSNVGFAGTIDLFKFPISGSDPELSRALLDFDLSSVYADIDSGAINPDDSSFECRLVLKDIYGGQTTPKNFTLCLAPLAKAWQEGVGLDIGRYVDKDVANFLTASTTNGVDLPWTLPGAGSRGSGSVDVYTFTTSSIQLEKKQTFLTGYEDLSVDITDFVRMWHNGAIAKNGVCLYFSASHEADDLSYFVKRFGSSQSILPQYRPYIDVKYFDSNVEQTSDRRFGVASEFVLKNGINGVPSNLNSVSGSQLTGSNCLELWLTARLGSGSFSASFSGSQESVGSYTSNVLINPTDPSVLTQLNASGSVVFDFSWKEKGSPLTYQTGSAEYRTTQVNPNTAPRKLAVNCNNVSSEYRSGYVIRPLVFITDLQKPYVRSFRVPVKMNSLVLEAHYQLRIAFTEEVVIQPDLQKKSTMLSFDGEFMTFDLHTTGLPTQQSYVIDILCIDGGRHDLHKNASPRFRLV